MQIPDGETYAQAGRLLQLLDIMLGFGRLTLEVRTDDLPRCVYTWHLEEAQYSDRIALEAINVRNIRSAVPFAANAASRMLKRLIDYADRQTQTETKPCASQSLRPGTIAKDSMSSGSTIPCASSAAATKTS